MALRPSAGVIFNLGMLTFLTPRALIENGLAPNMFSHLQIIFSFARESYINYIFTYKPHPQNQNTFFKANFKGIKFTKENIEDLFKKSDLVICSNSTITAIECCYADIPLFTYLDNNNFNLSPLKEMNGSKFFSNYADFDALMKIIEKEKYDFKFNKNYFCVDESLTNWNEKFISKISNK